YIVENSVIRRALLAYAETLETVALAFDSSIDRLDRRADRVVASLAGGESLIARLAVAADGKNSRLRREAGIGVTERRYPQTAIVCTVAHERPHGGAAQERFLPAGPFAILPMRGNRSSIVWTERTAL